MALTFLNPAMIDQPANISYLSASNLVGGNLVALNAELSTANVKTLSAYNFYSNNIINNTDLFGNLTVYGGITAVSGINILNTFNSNTTALSVINVGANQALYVSQGTNIAGVASFVGTGQEILRINNIDPDFNQPTVVITKGPTNKSLSAEGIVTFENVNSPAGTIQSLNATNFTTSSATVDILTNNIANTNIANTNILNSNNVNTNALVMPTSSTAFFGNMTVYGAINALSGITNIASFISQTSALSVVNTGPAPALYVNQAPTVGSIASFVGGAGGAVEVLRVVSPDPSPLIPGIIVTGNVSATQVVYGSQIQDGQGNSNNWNLAYTNVQSNSANWNTGYTQGINSIQHNGNIKSEDLVVGTNDIYGLKLRTNSTTRATITNIGNVGIGTETPNTKLTVVGTISSSGDTILNGSQVINTNSNFPGLRINQIGTGNALEVEDDTYPDSTLFKISSSGQVTVGTTSSADSFVNNGNLNVMGTGRIANFIRYDDAAAAAALGFYKTRGGSPNAHSLLQAGNNIANIIAFVSNGLSSYANVGQTVFQADSNYTPSLTSLPTTFNIFTTNPNTTAGVLKFRCGEIGATVYGDVSASGLYRGSQQYIRVTFSFNTSADGAYLVDTTSSVVSGTLPPAPLLGDSIRFNDPVSKWSTNNFVVLRNGNLIESLAEDLVCEIDDSNFTLTFVGGTRGWKVT